MSIYTTDTQLLTSTYGEDWVQIFFFKRLTVRSLTVQSRVAGGFGGEDEDKSDKSGR